jgi:long-chain acyl-CoA synthetase
MTARNQGDRIVTDRPDQTAIVSTVDGASVTYGELEQLVTSIAAFIAGRTTPGDSVGILAENSIAWVATFFAIQRAGAVPVPISHRLPASGVDFVVTDANIVLLFTDEASRPVAPAGVDLADLSDVFALPTAGSDGAAFTSAAFASYVPAPGDLGMILYTSGTTGHPKGVELTQESHLWVIDQTSALTAPGTNRTIISAPLYHMNALTNTQRLLASGGTIVLMPRFDPAEFLRAIDTYAVTDLSGVPPMFAMLANQTDLLASADLSSVRNIAMASAPASRALFRQLSEWFPSAAVTFGFGTTESGPVVFRAHPDGLPTPLESVGVANPAVTLRLVDAAGAEVADEGVLEILSPGLMKGYRNRPDLVPPVTADGYHHTRDIFRVDVDGFYFFQGREDDMFVTGGENVFPRAVERVLESHPAVGQAIVLPVPDEVKGTKPVAFVTFKPGATATEAELKAHVLAQMEPFAHPRRIWTLDEIPLSATNKADRAALTRFAIESLQ